MEPELEYKYECDYCGKPWKFKIAAANCCCILNDIDDE
jgi:hypothetical protein